MNRVVVPVLLLLTACMREPTMAAPTAPPAAAPVAAAPVAEHDGTAAGEDCTLATRLVPGVPGSPGHLIVSTRNPNGDSELAVLMRRMVDDLRDARTLLEAKQPVKKLLPDYRRIRCAWPTKEDMRSQKFEDLAIAYLGMVKAYDEAPSQTTYNGLVAGCIACHSQSCGGPLDFIDSMKWQ